MIYSYDGTEEKCPVPLVQTRLLLKKMTLGDQCLIVLKDKGSIVDIPKLLIKQGYDFKQQALEHGVVKIYIEYSPKQLSGKN